MKKRLTYFIFSIVFVVSILSGVRVTNAESASLEEQSIELKDIRDQVNIKFEASTSNSPVKFGREGKAPQEGHTKSEEQKKPKFERRPYSSKLSERVFETIFINELTLLERATYRDTKIHSSAFSYKENGWSEAKERHKEALGPERLSKWKNSNVPIKIHVMVAHDDWEGYIEAKYKIEKLINKLAPDLEKVTRKKIVIVPKKEDANITIRLPTVWTSGNARDRTLAMRPSKDCKNCSYFVNEATRVFAEPLKQPRRNRSFGINHIVYLIYNFDYSIRGSHCLLTKSGFRELNQFVEDCLVTSLGLANINKHHQLTWTEYLSYLDFLYSSELKLGMKKVDVPFIQEHDLEIKLNQTAKPLKPEKKDAYNPFPVQDPIKEFPPKLKENDPITSFLDKVLIKEVTLEMKALVPMWDNLKHVPVTNTEIIYNKDNAFVAQEVFSDTIIPNRLVLWDKTKLTIKIYGSITYYDQRIEGEKAFKKVKDQLESATGLSLELVDYQVPKTDIVIKFPDSRISRNAPKLVATKKDKYKTYYTNQAITVYPMVFGQKSSSYIKKFDLNRDYTFSSVLCQNTQHDEVFQVDLFIKGCMISALGLPNNLMDSELNFEEGLRDLSRLYSGKLKPGMSEEKIKSVLTFGRD